jgi:hypothetical protein
MCPQPKGSSSFGRIDTGFIPPGGLIAAAMNLSVVSSTQRDRELIADFAPERA